MNQDYYLEQIFYHYILDNFDMVGTIKPQFFSNGTLKELFKITKDYVINYKEAPSFDQVKNLIAINKKENSIPMEVVNVIYKNKDNVKNFTDEWLRDNVISWATWTNFILSLHDTITQVKMVEGTVTSTNAKELVEKLKGGFTKTASLNYDDDSGSDFFDPEAHVAAEIAKFTTGYPYVDLCTRGGYWPGSLWVWMGAPKAGKSLVLQNLIAALIKTGKNAAYITLELSEAMIIHRIGANLFNIDSYEYEKLSKDKEKVKTIMTKWRTDNAYLTPGYLHIKEYPTSTASVFDVEAHLLKKEEEISNKMGKPFKFHVVYIDYINIMKNWRNPNSENTYMKIKQIAEDLRAMGQRNNWCIVTATQTGRGAFDASDVTASDVSESAALNATVDMMFAIIKDLQMDAASLMYWKCLLSRVSPLSNTRKKFDIQKKFMRLVENANEEYVSDATLETSITNKARHGGSFNRSATASVRQAQYSETAMSGTPIEQQKVELINYTGDSLF